MKIKAFNKNKKTKNYLISGVIFLTLSVIGITLYKSFALYKEEATYNVLRGIVPEFSSGDIELAFTVGGNKQLNAFPDKENGYEINSVTCENGVTAEWDSANWGLINIKPNGKSKIKCNIDFKTKATYYIKNMVNTSNELADDGTEDHNIRYISSDPNNYVSFNGELWRIIGVMNDVEDETGTIEPRIKLIRSESIGSYSWDNKASGTGSSTTEYGSNDWSDSAIQEVLNSGAYYNRTSGLCPSGKYGATTECDFSSNGLTNEAKSMISKVKWKLGGIAKYTNTSNELASHWYGYERGSEVNTGKPTEWTGEVGLMYPSDYGYATSGGSTTDRMTCLNTTLYSWKESSVSDCKNNDWLYSSSDSQWTIAPASVANYIAFYVESNGFVFGYKTSDTRALRPSVYLSTSTKIVSGTGRSSDPYILEA